MPVHTDKTPYTHTHTRTPACPYHTHTGFFLEKWQQLSPWVEGGAHNSTDRRGRVTSLSQKGSNPAKYRFSPHYYGSRSHLSKQTSVVLKIKSSNVSSLDISIILSVYSHTNYHIHTYMQSVPHVIKYILIY